MRDCPLCGDLYDRGEFRLPLVLSCCGNTICSKCWNALKADKKSCPFDRNFIRFDNPVTNRVVLSEIEAKNDEIEVRDGISQFVCEAENCENEAKFYCKSCKVNLCEKCDEEIHRKVSKHQRILVFDKEFEYRECGKHKEEFKLFCETHDTIVCSVCVSLDHKLFCVIKGVNEVALVKKELVEKKISEIEVLKNDVSQKINELTGKQDEMKNAENKRLYQIQQIADFEIEKIKAKCNADMNAEREKFSKEKEHVHSVMSEYLENMNRLEKIIKESTIIRNRSSAVYAIKVAESLRSIFPNNPDGPKNINFGGSFEDSSLPASDSKATIIEKEKKPRLESKEPEEFKCPSSQQYRNLINRRMGSRRKPHERARYNEEIITTNFIPVIQNHNLSLEELRYDNFSGNPFALKDNCVDNTILNNQSLADHENASISESATQSTPLLFSNTSLDDSANQLTTRAAEEKEISDSITPTKSNIFAVYPNVLLFTLLLSLILTTIILRV